MKPTDSFNMRTLFVSSNEQLQPLTEVVSQGSQNNNFFCYLFFACNSFFTILNWSKTFLKTFYLNFFELNWDTFGERLLIVLICLEVTFSNWASETFIEPQTHLFKILSQTKADY